ncbi:MAG: insulinase family protein [Deltaproteobacteria bacterium]|nr:MAG: insulinase family protein [Deltaproteobacteria bacterium]
MIFHALLLSVSLARSPLPDDSKEASPPASSGPDRRAPPAVRPVEPISLPPITTHTLRPGVVVHHVRVEGLRRARVRILFGQGALALTGRDSAAFTAMAWIQDQATRGRSAQALADYKDRYDLDLWTDGTLRHHSVHLACPLEDLDRGLRLMREVLVEPRFPRSDVRTLRRSMTRALLIDGPRRAGSVIDAALRYGWYAPEHPLGGRPDIRGWYKVRRRHLRGLHRQLLETAPLEVLVVADADLDALLPDLTALTEGLGHASEPTPPLPEGGPASSKVIGIDFGSTTTASVALRRPAPSYADPELPAFAALDHALGGPFLSRLNRELREEWGLTYGIDASLTTRELEGHWTIRTEVHVDRLGQTLDLIEAEVERASEEGLREEELRAYQTKIVHAWNRNLSTSSTAARAYGRWTSRGEGVDQARSRVEAVRELTLGAPQEAGRLWLDADRPALLVVVGDQERIDPQLQERGLEVHWIPAGLMLLGGP